MNLNRTKTIKKHLLYNTAIFDSGSKNNNKKSLPLVLVSHMSYTEKM